MPRRFKKLVKPGFPLVMVTLDDQPDRIFVGISTAASRQAHGLPPVLLPVMLPRTAQGVREACTLLANCQSDGCTDRRS